MSVRNREYIDFLKQRFDEKKFIEFISDLLNLSSSDINSNVLEQKPEQKQFIDSIDYYKFIANYESNSDRIGTFIVKLTDVGSQNARTAQRTFISILLNKYNLDAALVAFYQDNEATWRLSFVKKELNFTEKGIKVDLTPAKRFSYLVGENESVHTAQEYLFSLLNIEDRKITLSDIEKVFDVEKVTKKFFEEYKEKYLGLKEFLDKNADFITESENCDFTSEEFAKKLMGQIVFLYFLQKKGWLGVQIVPEELSFEEYNEISKQTDSVCNNLLEKYYIREDSGYKVDKSSLKGETIQDNINNFISIFKGTKYDKAWGTGDKQFVRNMFKKSRLDHKDNFFDDYLEPFFYTGLNEKRENQYFVLFNCKIPFLNGGLFEPINNYRWSSAQFNIPDEMFSNDKKDGILDIFDLYNFTIDEEEPLEKDIAVDPEMLGKIFENLLDVKDRKSTGSFYTPREVVHYMCQESLADYIVNKLSIPYDDIVNFIKYGDVLTQTDWTNAYNNNEHHILPESIWNNIIEIDKALIDIKIADPAVGSGAFPLGILNEIVKLRDNITSYLEIQKDKGIITEEEYLLNTTKRSIYEMKLQTIQNSIYAVDIEISAVDIAKLRLWLSLIVDYPNEHEPRPLPNLDCKIMQGNSLLDEYEGIPLFSERELSNNLKNYKRNLSNNTYIRDIVIQQTLVFDDDNSINYENMLSVMLELQKEYFITSDNKLKKALKEKIDNIQISMVQQSLVNNPLKLSEFNEIAKKKSKPWFIWRLEFFDVFKNNNGFDIVIGNPPYIGQKGHKELFDMMSNNPNFEKKMDYWYFFLHEAYSLTNISGIVSFITPNYWITAQGGKKLRNRIVNDFDIIKYINFNNNKVFTAGVHTNVFVLNKIKKKDHNIDVCIFNNDYDNSLIDNMEKENNFKVNQKILLNKWTGFVTFIDTKNLNLLTKLTNNCEKLCDNESTGVSQKGVITGKKVTDGICNLNQGIVTGKDRLITDNSNNGVFILYDEEIPFLHLNDEEKKYIKPFYKNSDIEQFISAKKSNTNLLYINSIDSEDELKKLPNIYNHIIKYKDTLLKRSINGVLQSAFSKGKWWALTTDRPNIDFNGKKIVFPQRSKINKFAYSTNQFYSSADIYYMSMNKENYDMKYILGILNSKLTYYWLYWMGKRKGEALELYLEPLQFVPIKKIDKEAQRKIIDIVDNILNNVDYNSNIKLLNNEIYNLYDLSSEEIRIIEELYNEKI